MKTLLKTWCAKNRAVKFRCVEAACTPFTCISWTPQRTTIENPLASAHGKKLSKSTLVNEVEVGSKRKHCVEKPGQFKRWLARNLSLVLHCCTDLEHPEPLCPKCDGTRLTSETLLNLFNCQEQRQMCYMEWSWSNKLSLHQHSLSFQHVMS